VKIEDQDKIKILLTLLDRRYESIEKIRERVYNISIWTLGIFLGAAGLLVQGSIVLDWPAKVFAVLAEVFAVVSIIFYIKDLESGFRNQFRVAIQIERALGLSEKGAFGLDEGVLPSEWSKAGTKKAQGRFFRNTYLLLYLGAALLLAAIVSSGLVF
jgi:hypothetical protein